MKASHAIVPIFTLTLFTVSTASAQVRLPKYEFGARLSSMFYQGDLSPSAIGSYKTPRFGIGVFATRIFGNSLSVRANLDYGKLRGNDAAYSQPEWRQNRNFNFTATTLELAGHLVYNFKGNYDQSARFSPYAFGGAGVSFLNINRDYSAFNPDYFANEAWVGAGLAEDIQKTLPRATLVLPVGLGLKYPVSQKLSIFSEASYRFMFTDYLDGFSKSASANQNDHYYNISVGLTYRFGNNGINCPSF
jgi:hypothetical protein